MLTTEDIKTIKDLIKETIKDLGIVSTSNCTQKIVQSSSNLDSPVQREIFRRKLVKEIIDLDESDTDEDTKKELQQEREELLKTCKVVDDEDFQEILDTFDFEKCVSVADSQDYRLGLDQHRTTVEDLIADTLDCYKRLENSQCGRLQYGRIILYKLWDFEEAENWYSLNYIVENGENF